ncbi:hypothetical protein BDV96DRAFT_652032 [Lophiotrema nucula]|uniref:RRM domain-containing protein n=1 Tax=Lophiotrema nucula TaxID=690887 RepID=A0A6A5YQE8_9PLEO|nr:hypothetical protein BDV96DRAFT_652032 [Lophiotrema nucula]
MADDFDIDIYGDDSAQDYQDTPVQGADVKQDDSSAMHTDSHYDEPAASSSEIKAETPDQKVKQESSQSAAANGNAQQENGTQQISSTSGSNDQIQLPKQAPQQQGVKRKQGDDDERPTDPGATAALMINDLHWWISEEDIRGWANQSGCEDELLEVTFNEHKVNGKSKGQVYVHLQTPQAATALKHQLESFYKDQAHAKKPTAIYNAPHVNPFKTLPKDVPARDKNRGDRSSSSNFSGNQGGNSGGFNNNRFNNRGNYNNNSRGGFQNRNFSGPASGNNMGGNIGGGFGGPGPMNNFGGGPMGGMNNFGGGGFNRGGNMMGGMRGGMNNRGRGGAMGGMGNMGGGMNMPMGGNMMGMAGNMMGMGGNMGGNMGMMGGMGGPGFGGSQHFNPGFFNQNQGGGDSNWNPHPAKRPRPE